MTTITDLKPIDGNTAFALPRPDFSTPHPKGLIRGFIASTPSAGAWVDGALKAFAYSSKLAPGILQLEHIFVSADMRSRGLGRLLLSHLEKQGSASGYEAIILACDEMRPREKSSKDFFLHNGFSSSVSTSPSTLLCKSIR